MLFIASLKTGGAQRQVIALAPGMAKKGMSVHLVTIFPGGSFGKRRRDCQVFTWVPSIQNDRTAE